MTRNSNSSALARLVGAILITLGLLGLASNETVAEAQPDDPKDAASTMVPELEPNLGWLNSDKPLRFREELKGHIVILDFWTYCCINCMHILPDLEYLEEKYKDDPVVVIGVHSAKFQNESERQSIRNAVQRYSITHPVVIDDDMQIWKKFGASGWPTFVVIDSRGRYIDHASGEGHRNGLNQLVETLLEKGKKEGTLAPKKVALKPDATVQATGGLRFPGKVHAFAGDEKHPGRLFIADSTHHRIVAATLPDAEGRCEAVKIYGIGSPGLADGEHDACGFFDPQGMAYDPDRNTLYVADTKDHAIRAIDLTTDMVTTVSGGGMQGNDRRGGKAKREQLLNSPWDVVLSADRKILYIAMAGTHQIWQLDLATDVATALAGSGSENIKDGPAASAALAQTSGLALASDARTLFFADSETSSIRRLDLAKREVSTIIGAGLFEFGDIDGAFPKARLQHCLGVTLDPSANGDRLLVADTYNHKIKTVNPDGRAVAAWTGASRGSVSEAALSLDEPGGLHLLHGPNDTKTLFVADTNNHRIVMVDATTKAWREVMISGLTPPQRGISVPDDAIRVDISAKEGAPLVLQVAPTLATDVHLNVESPTTLRVSIVSGSTIRVIGNTTVRTRQTPVAITLPVAALVPGTQLLIEFSYATCTEGNAGLCMPGNAAWLATIRPGQASTATLTAP